MSDTQESLALVVKEFNLGTLTTNARTILETVKTKLLGYKAENYSGDKIQEAKADRAALNTTAKVLNAQRIEYEKRWMKPFDEFKNLVAETCEEIKKASAAIDQVIKEVEQAEKEEKRKQIAEYFDSQGVDLVRLEQIMSPQWLNKTCPLKDIKAEILARIDKTKMDLEILDKIGEPEARAHYLSTLDLNSAIAAADRIKTNRDRLAEAERARQAPPPPEKYDEATIGKICELANPKPSVMAEPLFTYTLRILGTYADLRDLRLYMEAHAIIYDKISEGA
jgi:hypothetical protein